MPARLYAFLYVVLFVIVAWWWLKRLRPGLWLDETVTAWIIKGGAATTIDRAWEYQGQSPLYFLTVWATKEVLGSSEFVLRAPSLVAGVVGVVLMAKLGTRLIDSDAGRFAALVYACAVARDAANARPYALGLCLVIAAALAAVAWSERPSWAATAVLAVTTALIAWVHVLFVLAWPGIYALALRGRDRRRLLIAVVGTAVLVLPLLPHIAWLFDRREQLSFAAPPPMRWLISDVVHPKALLALAVGAAVAFAPCSGARVRPCLRPALFVPLAVWASVAPIALFVVSRLGDAQIYVPRYFSSAVPPFVLLFAWTHRWLTQRTARAAVAISVVALCLTGLMTFIRTGPHDDWRAATRAIPSGPDALILVRSGLIESNDPSWLTDPARQEYLLAPVGYYPVSGAVRLLPRDRTAATEPVFAALLDEAARHGRVIIVTRPWSPERLWFDDRLRASGHQSNILANGPLVVTAYQRSP